MTQQLVPAEGGRVMTRTPVRRGTGSNIVSMQPQSFGELMQFADAISKTFFVPKEFQGKPNDILAAVQYGAELGLPAMQALQGICVINGKPSVYGDTMLALIRASGLLEEIEEWFDVDTKGVVTCAWCRSKRFGQKEKVTPFSMADAQKAQLLGKQGPWTQYPQRMLMFRARAWNLRDNFGDVLKGMACREEMEDYHDLPAATTSVYEQTRQIATDKGAGVRDRMAQANLTEEEKQAAKEKNAAIDRFINLAETYGYRHVIGWDLSSKKAARPYICQVLGIDSDCNPSTEQINEATDKLKPQAADPDTQDAFADDDHGTVEDAEATLLTVPPDAPATRNAQVA